MARKRMFDQEITSQDRFTDRSLGAIGLYFILGMEADDEGFVSPRRVMKLYGATEEQLNELINADFLIEFETGVVLIVDFNRNNYLNQTRITKTIYTVEKKQISYNEETKKYERV